MMLREAGRELLMRQGRGGSEGQREREMGKERDRRREREIEGEKDRGRERESQRERERDRESEKEIHPERYSERDAERNTEREGCLSEDNDDGAMPFRNIFVRILDLPVAFSCHYLEKQSASKRCSKCRLK
jgi:hypothetical protein